MTLDGKEVLTIRPDFAEPPELAGSRLSTMVDLSFARRIGFFPGLKVTHSLSHRYVLRAPEIVAFEKFFNDRSGKWEAFLCPSWSGEMGVSETNVTNSPASAADLWVDWCDFSVNYGPTPGRLGEYVWLLWDDGTTHFAKVLSVSATSAGVFDKLLLDTNLPKLVDVLNPPVVGFLYLVRFASDELELSYSGPNSAECEMAFLEETISVPEADVV